MSIETTKRVKVIGGNLDGVHRVIVACRSMAEFSRITHMPISHARQYACETGNEEEIGQATSEPGTPFKRKHAARDGTPWEKMK